MNVTSNSQDEEEQEDTSEDDEDEDDTFYDDGRNYLYNPHHSSNRKSVRSAEQTIRPGASQGQSPPTGSQPVQHQQQGMSELDKLFAKLGPTAQPTGLPTSPAHSNGTSVGGNNNSIMQMLNGSFTSPPRGVNSLHQLPSNTGPPTASTVAPPPLPPQTGIALLNSMFASVSGNIASPSASQQSLPASSSVRQPPFRGAGNHDGSFPFQFPSPPAISAVAVPQHNMGTNGSPMQILSPKPSAGGLPQILTTSVLHELMGLPVSSSSGTRSRSDSRTSTSASSQSQHKYYTGSQAQNANTVSAYPNHSPSSASSAKNTYQYQYSPSSAGARRSRERGYIADRGEDDGGLSEEESTGVESEAPPESSSVQASRAPLPHTLVPRASFISSGGSSSGVGVKGDATPRARSERLSEPHTPGSQTRTPAARPAIGQATMSETHVQTVAATTGPSARRPGRGGSIPAPAPASAPATARGTMPMPFQAGSDLWPGEAPRSADARTTTTTITSSAGGASGNSNSNGARAAVEDAGDDIVELDFSEIGVLEDLRALESKAGHGGIARGKKVGRKDAGTKVQSQQATPGSGSGSVANGTEHSEPTSNLASPAKDKEGEKRGRGKKEKKTLSTPAPAATPLTATIVNGTSTHAPPSSSASTTSLKSITSTGTVTSKASAASPSAVTPALAKDLLLEQVVRSGLNSASQKPALEKVAFIREVLTLIHVSRDLL